MPDLSSDLIERDLLGVVEATPEESLSMTRYIDIERLRAVFLPDDEPDPHEVYLGIGGTR